MPEIEQLARHRVVQAVDARDPVSNGEDRADLRDVDRLLVAGELLLQNLRDLIRLDLHQVLAFSFVCF